MTMLPLLLYLRPWIIPAITHHSPYDRGPSIHGHGTDFVSEVDQCGGLTNVDMCGAKEATGSPLEEAFGIISQASAVP